MAKMYRMAVHDLSGKRLCVLFDSQVPQIGAAHDLKIDKEVNGWKEISFNLSKCDVNGEQNYRCDFIKNENHIYLTEDGITDVYCIKSPAALHDKSKLQFTVTCNHISEELKTKNLFKYFDDENGIGTCQELIEKAISGSGWKLVECDTFLESDGITEKVRSYSCDTKTGAQNMIKDICDLFGARPVYHGYEKTIEIHATSNTTGWMEVMFGKNADKIKRIPDSSNIVTKLYVEGEYGDFGYVGIDDINPTGLPFIFNFDYYKELGIFTDEHQAIVDEYTANYKNISETIKNASSERLKKEGELNILIGSFGYAYYHLVDNIPDFENVIVGGTTTLNDAKLESDDTIYAVREDGSYDEKTYSNSDTYEGYKCIIKFWPTITGQMAAYEDKIQASYSAIESLLKSLNKYLRTNSYPETTVEELKQVYGTGDLSIVKDEGFDVSALPEQYRQETTLQYSVSIGLEEKDIASYQDELKISMNKAIDLMFEIDELKSDYDMKVKAQDVIDENFANSMGSLLKEGYYSDENYTIGQEQALYNDSLEISKKLAYPVNSYDISIQNLSVSEKYAGEEFKLAQTVRIYDKDLKMNDQGIVSQTIIYPEKPSSDTIKIKTDLLDIGSKSFSTILERITMLAEEVRRNRDIYKRASAISKNGSISSSLLEGSIDVMKTQLLSSASNWNTDSSGNIIFTSLDGNSAMLLAGNGFMIANSKLENGDWNWRTFGTGDGFAADLITTGFLSAERIAANSITVNKLSSDVGESLDLSSNKSIDLRVTTLVESQIGKLMNVVHVGEEPLEPTVDMIWLDATVEPNIFKRWTGEEWVIVNDISELAQKINSAELKIDAYDASINAMVESIDIISDRVEAAELKITPEAITQVVRDSDTYKEDLASATMTADKFETFVSGSQGISSISQKANEIDLLIESDSSSTEVKFTDAAIQAFTDEMKVNVTDQIELKVGELQEQVDSAETQIKANTDAIALKASEQDVGILKERISEAEEKITPEAIVQTVRTSQGYTEDLEELSDRIATAESSIEQHSDEIALRVTKEEYSIIENKVVEQQSQIIQQAGSITLLAGRMGDVEVAVEDTSIHEGATPPEAPLNEGKIWLDSSVNPPIFRRWLGLDVPTDRYYSATEGGSIVQTPSQFDDIVSVSTEFFLMQDGIGDPYSAGGGKNLLEVTVGSQTVSGVTFVVNADGSIVADGTAEANVFLTVSDRSVRASGEAVVLNGCPAGGAQSTYMLYYRCDANGTEKYDVGRGIEFVAQDEPCRAVISIRSGVTVNSLTFYPMLRRASDTDATFAPYKNIRPISSRDGLSLKHYGRNLVRNNLVNKTADGLTYTVNGDGSVVVNGTSTRGNAFQNLNYGGPGVLAIPPGRYILSGGSKNVRVQVSAPDIIATAGENEVEFEIPESVATSWVRLQVLNAGTVVENETVYPMVRTIFDKDPTYTPYQGVEYTADFGQTVYGGSYDWNAGTLVSNMLCANAADLTVSTVGTTNAGVNYARLNLDIRPISETGASSHYKIVPAGAAYASGMARFFSGYIFIYDARFTDTDTVIGILTAENPQFVYEVEPIEIQLDPQQIVPFDGTNVFYGDGEIFVTYTGTGWETVNDTRELEESISKTVTKTELQHIIRIESDGLHVGAQGSQSEAIIDNDSFDIAFGGQVFSSFAGNYVEFGNYQIRRTADGGLAFKLR